jgi:hypothetical protein
MYYMLDLVWQVDEDFNDLDYYELNLLDDATKDGSWMQGEKGVVNSTTIFRWPRSDSGIFRTQFLGTKG